MRYKQRDKQASPVLSNQSEKQVNLIQNCYMYIKNINNKNRRGNLYNMQSRGIFKETVN